MNTFPIVQIRNRMVGRQIVHQRNQEILDTAFEPIKVRIDRMKAEIQTLEDNFKVEHNSTISVNRTLEDANEKDAATLKETVVNTWNALSNEEKKKQRQIIDGIVSVKIKIEPVIRLDGWTEGRIIDFVKEHFPFALAYNEPRLKAQAHVFDRDELPEKMPFIRMETKVIPAFSKKFWEPDWEGQFIGEEDAEKQVPEIVGSTSPQLVPSPQGSDTPIAEPSVEVLTDSIQPEGGDNIDRPEHLSVSD